MRAFGLLLALTLWALPAQAESALEMASFCRPVAKSAPDSGGFMYQVPPTFEAGRCWGAFSAIQAALVIGDEERPYLRDCPLPGNSSRLQLIRVFLRYIDQHPESYDENFVLVALSAFDDAFPCQ